MSNYESDPMEVAARYRVKKDEEGKFQICSKQGSPVNLSRQSISLSFQTTLKAVRWKAVQWYGDPTEDVIYDKDAFYTIELIVAKLVIGYNGSNGSPTNELVDNCFFGINGETLSYLPFTTLRVVSEAQRNTEESINASNSGLEFIPKPKRENEVGRATFGYYDLDGLDYYFDDSDPSVECHIALPQAHFQQLLDGCLSGRVSGVYFGGNGGALSSGIENSYQPGPSGSVRDVILLEGEEFDIHIDTLIIDYCGVKPEAQAKYDEEITPKRWVLYNGTQIGGIGRELVKSLNAWLEQNPKEQNDSDEYLDSIGDLIGELRGCCYWLRNEDLEEKELLSLSNITGSIFPTPGGFLSGEELDSLNIKGSIFQSPGYFLNKIEGHSKDEKGELVAKYDQIWNHKRIISIRGLISTEGVRKIKLYGKPLEIPVLLYDRLEKVAQMYIANPWMQSPHLEWLLMDALLFAETARYIAILSDIPVQKFIPMIMQSLVRPIKLFLWEGFSLALTAFLSNLIAETHDTVFWIIFATVTLGRWLNPIKTQQEIQRQKRKQLVDDMTDASDKLREFDFNAMLLRERLYDLEKRGAFYSPSIFNVLDKKIARTR